MFAVNCIKVSLYVSMYVFVCVCVCVCVCVRARAHAHTRVHTLMYVCMSIDYCFINRL